MDLQFILFILFIYDEIVQEYTEKYKDKFLKKWTKIGLRHTQRCNNKHLK